MSIISDDIVSDFIVKTCWLNQRPNRNKFKAWMYSNSNDNYNTTTGSVSELYIEPMLPCVGDIDVMVDIKASGGEKLTRPL